MVIESAWSRQLATAERVLGVQTPYLVALGSPPMRFLAPAPPRDLVTHPPAAAPPQPPLAAPTRPDFVPADPPTTTAPVVVAQTPAAPDPAATEESSPPKRVLPILVDELRPRVRAEDFLPFFQIPAGQDGVDVIVPVPRGSAPAALPTSSATYTQSPR